MYGQPLTWWQRFSQRFMPTPLNMAKAELKDAELAHLQSISMAEYADLRMQTHKLTADYHNNRAGRLRAYVEKHDRSLAEPLYPEASVLRPVPGDDHFA